MSAHIRKLLHAGLSSAMIVGVLAASLGPGAAPVAARPLYAATAGISLDLPTSGFIGEPIDFTVTFDNLGADPGYGPYIDLFLPLSGVDGQTGGGPDDGLSLTGASYLGTPVITFQVTGAAGTTVNHPLADITVTFPLTMAGYTGSTPFMWELTVFQLPFGSFTNDQPPATVAVSADLSAYADLGIPLEVYAGGGFMFGEDPLDNPDDDPPLVQAVLDTASLTPTLIELQRSTSGRKTRPPPGRTSRANITSW